MAAPNAWTKANAGSGIKVEKGTPFLEATKAVLVDGSESVYKGNVPIDWCFGNSQ